MKIMKKIVKGVMKGILIVFIICIAVFTVAGLIPVKDKIPGTRYSTYVEMEDGTKIAIRYLLPLNMDSGTKIPAIVEGTRYGTLNKESFLLAALINLGIAREIPPSSLVHFLEAQYAYVAIDARGSGASFGQRDMEWSKQEIADMGEVIDWITKQKWSNGEVGLYGVSYSANTAELATALNNPAVKAAAPLYADFEPTSSGIMPGGIYNEFLVKNWCEGNISVDENKNTLFTAGTAPVDEDKNGKLLKEAIKSHKTIDIYTALNNNTYIDDQIAEGYTLKSFAPFTYKEQIEESDTPLYFRVGWQDAGTVNGAIERFLTYQNKQTLIIGPWSHGGHYFYDPLLQQSISREELDHTQDTDMIAFFDQYLKPNNMEADTSENRIMYYTYGEGKWKTTNTWPVAGFDNTIFYFDQNDSLSTRKPVTESGKDTYEVDFTATTGETNRWRTNLGGGEIFYPDRALEDQKLLTYTSKAMENDIEITGVPVVTLNVSSTANDGAFYAYLEDVAPDGKVTYITEGELRALHRNVTDKDLGRVVLGPRHSYERENGELLNPGSNTELKIGMFATSVLIEKGHRIRISIAGSDTSNFRRIPDTDATIEVQRNSQLCSYVELPIKAR